MIRLLLMISAGLTIGTNFLYAQESYVPISFDEMTILVPHETSPDNSMVEAFMQAINNARRQEQDCGSEGIKPPAPMLQWSDILYDASYEHSYDMAMNDTVSHSGTGKTTDLTAQALHPGTGSAPRERIEHNGYTNWKMFGENVAAGNLMETAAEAVDAWINSPGHCANLMNPDFTEVGLARVFNADSTYLYYWTMELGNR